jgi:hypothetical protein
MRFHDTSAPTTLPWRKSSEIDPGFQVAAVSRDYDPRAKNGTRTEGRAGALGEASEGREEEGAALRGARDREVCYKNTFLSEYAIGGGGGHESNVRYEIGGAADTCLDYVRTAEAADETV